MLGTQQEIVGTILRAQVLMLRRLRACTLKEGLTIQQFGVLRLLFQRGPFPMSTLSKELGVTPPVVTGIVDRLEEKKFVKRTWSANDRRKTEMVLTNGGKKVYTRISEEYWKSTEESLRKSLTRTEQETLSNLLGKFVKEIVVQ
jgi:MarR family transcriptional regulator, 2-MHQ and catechol-resistance regulon repressor